MDVMQIVNWMQRDTFPDGTIRKWALTQEALPEGVPFMGGFVELFPGAALPLTVAVQAAQADYDRQALQAILLAALAAHRYDVQNGGTTVNGISLDTDSDSRSALTAAFMIATLNPSYTCNWKTATGAFVDLDAPAVIAVGNGVLAFVQKCFDTEKALTAAVANYSSVEAILAAFDTGMTA